MLPGSSHTGMAAVELTAMSFRLIAAFTSRSWIAPQTGPVHSRTDSGRSPSLCPQAEHVVLLANQRSATIQSPQGKGETGEAACPHRRDPLAALHKLTTDLTRRCHTIGIESLNVRGFFLMLEREAAVLAATEHGDHLQPILG
jgi:hypothetical protein